MAEAESNVQRAHRRLVLKVEPTKRKDVLDILVTDRLGLNLIPDIEAVEPAIQSPRDCAIGEKHIRRVLARLANLCRDVARQYVVAFGVLPKRCQVDNLGELILEGLRHRLSQYGESQIAKRLPETTLPPIRG